MKIRQGFVSNSSSASYLVGTNELSEEITELLNTIKLMRHSCNYCVEYEKFEIYPQDVLDGWRKLDKAVIGEMKLKYKYVYQFWFSDESTWYELSETKEESYDFKTMSRIEYRVLEVVVSNNNSKNKYYIYIMVINNELPLAFTKILEFTQKVLDIGHISYTKSIRVNNPMPVFNDILDNFPRYDGVTSLDDILNTDKYSNDAGEHVINAYAIELIHDHDKFAKIILNMFDEYVFLYD